MNFPTAAAVAVGPLGFIIPDEVYYTHPLSYYMKMAPKLSPTSHDDGYVTIATECCADLQ